MMGRAFVVALNFICAASLAVAQRADTSSRVWVKGLVRNPNGAPVAGAVVQTTFPSQVTFTRSDGRFAVPRPVSAESAAVIVLHLVYAGALLRVSALPRAPEDSTTAVATVDLQRGAIDSTPGPSTPPFRITASSIPDAELDLITRATELPSMHDIARGSRDREIRVFIHGGAGTPDRAAMLRRSRGHVSGEVWLWWMLDPESGLDPASNWRLYAGTFGCADAPWQWATVLDGGVSVWRAVLVCRAALPVTPNWLGMWRRLDSLGVWRLSDQTARLHNRRPFVRDGAFVTLETFDGRTYRRIRHGDPDSIDAPGASRAAAIARALDPAFTAVRVEPARWTPPPVAFHIAGTVRDTAGRPVAGARIIVSGYDVTLRTGADGSFEIPYPVPFTAWLGFGGPGYRLVRYSIFQLPKPTYALHRRIWTEIVLHTAAPDTVIVADVPGYETAPDTSSPTSPDVANRVPPPWARRVHRGAGPPLGAPYSDLPPVHSCVPGRE